VDQFMDIEDSTGPCGRTGSDRVASCSAPMLRGPGRPFWDPTIQPSQKVAYAPSNASYGTSPKNRAKTGAPRTSLEERFSPSQTVGPTAGMRT
jgi:hypothetical protein